MAAKANCLWFECAAVSETLPGFTRAEIGLDCGSMIKLLLLSWALAGWMVRVADAGTIFNENFEAGMKAVWNPVEFEGKTEHTIVREGTNSVLRARAASSASGLGVKLEPAAAAGATVSWKWKIDRIPPGGSDDKKNTFDHTGRIFVAFKTLIGPPRTINYVWGNTVPAGGTFHHPSSGRSRFIVLQSGNARAGEWIAEQRDLARDWKILFGDDTPPPATTTTSKFAAGNSISER
jgi:hypothetical protein